MADARMVSLEQAAVELGIGRSTAYKLAAEGRFPLPVQTIGTCKRVSRRRLDDFIEAEITESQRVAV